MSDTENALDLARAVLDAPKRLIGGSHLETLACALLAAHERIERLRVVLRQADRTERDVRAMRKTAIVDDDFPFQLDRADASIRLLRQHLGALPPGDMEEPPK